MIITLKNIKVVGISKFSQETLVLKNCADHFCASRLLLEEFSDRCFRRDTGFLCSENMYMELDYLVHSKDPIKMILITKALLCSPSHARWNYPFTAFMVWSQFLLFYCLPDLCFPWELFGLRHFLPPSSSKTGFVHQYHDFHEPAKGVEIKKFLYMKLAKWRHYAQSRN